MLGSLFVRSIDTAERINIAMQARGFSGTWPATAKLKLQRADFIFATIAAAFIAVVYFYIRPVLS
jgi:energy-coupling factor transporter transmembrane protein EcfT